MIIVHRIIGQSRKLSGEDGELGLLSRVLSWGEIRVLGWVGVLVLGATLVGGCGETRLPGLVVGPAGVVVDWERCQLPLCRRSQLPSELRR